MSKFLFYRCVARHGPEPASLGERYRVVIWRPTWTEPVPDGMPLFPFAVWWLMHHLHVFANRGYCQLLILHDNRIVHRSVVTPRYFRFPFMREGDLQVGDTWTDPGHRGMGLASFALDAILRSAPPARQFWYLVERENVPSIRVAEKCGFRLAGRGLRSCRYGSSLLGAFIMTEGEARTAI
jgi:RimJ/RimL family protein N-acetyltransferase